MIDGPSTPWTDQWLGLRSEPLGEGRLMMLISRARHSVVSGCLFRPGRRPLCAVVTFGLSSGSRVYSGSCVALY